MTEPRIIACHGECCAARDACEVAHCRHSSTSNQSVRRKYAKRCLVIVVIAVAFAGTLAWTPYFAQNVDVIGYLAKFSHFVHHVPTSRKNPITRRKGSKDSVESAKQTYPEHDEDIKRTSVDLYMELGKLENESEEMRERLTRLRFLLHKLGRSLPLSRAKVGHRAVIMPVGPTVKRDTRPDYHGAIVGLTGILFIGLWLSGGFTSLVFATTLTCLLSLVSDLTLINLVSGLILCGALISRKRSGLQSGLTTTTSGEIEVQGGPVVEPDSQGPSHIQSCSRRGKVSMAIGDSDVRQRSPSSENEIGFSSRWYELLLRTLWIVLYFGFGIAVYSHLEGWRPLEASYFMMVTSTTVGYGDFSPTSDAGKVFTCLYALLGTTLIIEYLTPVVETILTPIRQKLEDVVHLNVDTRDLTLSLEEINSRISYPKRYLRAAIGPIILVVLGIIYGSIELELKPVDSLYWSIVTMTTIGFGDISSGATTTSKLFALVYLPLAVTAFADAIGAIAKIRIRRSIREKDLELQLEEILLEEAKGNPRKKTTEAEFLVRVLIENGVVDDETCYAVRRQFAAIVCEDNLSDDCAVEAVDEGEDEEIEPVVLDSRTVYNALKRHGRLMGADADRGYDEWRQHTWNRKVVAAENIGNM